MVGGEGVVCWSKSLTASPGIPGEGVNTEATGTSSGSNSGSNSSETISAVSLIRKAASYKIGSGVSCSKCARRGVAWPSAIMSSGGNSSNKPWSFGSSSEEIVVSSGGGTGKRSTVGSADESVILLLLLLSKEGTGSDSTVGSSRSKILGLQGSRETMG